MTEPTLRMALSKETVNLFIVLLESRSSSSSELLAPPTVTPGHMAGAQCHGNLTLLSFMETICGWFKAAGSSFRRNGRAGTERRRGRGKEEFIFYLGLFFSSSFGSSKGYAVVTPRVGQRSKDSWWRGKEGARYLSEALGNVY